MLLIYNGCTMMDVRYLISFFRKRSIRFCASRCGAGAVEFALIAPIIVIALAGMANYGMAMFQKMELESAARAGAQIAINDRTATTSIQNAVINATGLTLVSGDITLTEACWCADVSATETCGATCADSEPAQYFMTVSVTKSFDYLFGFDYLMGASAAITGSVKVRTE